MQIVRLADRPDLIPALAAAYETEWPEWYGPGGPGEALADLRERAQAGVIPLGLIAVEGDVLLGAAALAESSIESHLHLSPWLVALWTAPEHRRRGVGAAIINGCVAEARALGVERLYAATATAPRLFERCGWRFLEHGEDERHPASVFVISPTGVRDGAG